MWPMEEYAISRLILVWPMAAKAPSAIEAMATKTTICCHWAKILGKATIVVRTNMAMPATLGAAAKNAVIGVGAPSYTSGVHMWNGTAETLKQKPANRNTSPNTRPMPGWVAALAMPANETVPVKP